MRFSRRWVHWWVPIFLVVNYGIMAFITWKCFQNPDRWGPGSGLRIWTALMPVLGYWVLGSIFNSHKVTVRPSGVRFSVLPFPTGEGQFIRRRHIASSYARKILVISSEGYSHGHYFNMGIQTYDKHQVDIQERYNTAEEALAAARQVSSILNPDTEANPIGVEMVNVRHSSRTWLRQLLVWGAIILVALVLGILWDRADNIGI